MQKLTSSQVKKARNNAKALSPWLFGMPDTPYANGVVNHWATLMALRGHDIHLYNTGEIIAEDRNGVPATVNDIVQTLVQAVHTAREEEK